MPSSTDVLVDKLDPRLASLLRVTPQALLDLVDRDLRVGRDLDLRRQVLRPDLAQTFDDLHDEPDDGPRSPDGDPDEAVGARLAAFAARARAAIDARHGAVLGRTRASAAVATPVALSPLTTGVRKGLDGVARMRVLVRGDVTDEALGGDAVVRARAGRVALCELTPAQVRAVAALDGVEQVELARPVHAALDQVREELGMPGDGAAAAAADLPTGKGVVIGVVDFGLDLHHSELRRADGSSRVLGLWDQAAPEGPHGRRPAAGYGWEWDAADIAAELSGGAPPYAVVPHRWDRQGGHDPEVDGPAGGLWMRHGTHVACVAAGNGHSGLPGVRGIAPDAELLFVSLDPAVRLAGAEDLWGVAGVDRVVEGVKWILARADALQAERGQDLPVVINLSLADYTGPHDGHSNHQAFLDALQDLPGRIVVVAAGNANDQGGHVSRGLHPRGSVDPRGAHGATLALEVDEGAVADDACELWLEGLEDVALRLTIPGGDTTLSLPMGQAGADVVVTAGDRRVRLLAARVKRREAELQGIRVDILVEQGGLPTGTWALDLSGPGHQARELHAWLEWSNAGHRRWVDAVDGELTISDLGTHDALLVVGSTGKRLGGALSTPARHSGRGPTRDGRQKPDIAAPGNNLRLSEPHGRVHRGSGTGKEYLRGSGSGTSLATAVVSGACAVILECRGVPGQPAMLTTSELRQILRSTARREVGAPTGLRVDFEDGVHPAVGAGVLDLAAACRARRSAADLWSASSPKDEGVQPRAAPFFWVSPDIEVEPSGAPRGATPAGARVRVTVRNRGEADAHGVRVALGWGPPITWLPVDPDWLRRGEGPGWSRLRRGRDPGDGALAWSGEGVQADRTRSAVALVGRVPAGGRAVAEFEWAAPDDAPSAEQVAWFAMVSGGEDPDAGPFGRVVSASSHLLLRSRNEVATRSVVSLTPDADGQAELRLEVHGTPERDGLLLRGEGGARILSVHLPSQALPFYAGVPTALLAARSRSGALRDGSLDDARAAERALLEALGDGRAADPVATLGARGFSRLSLHEDKLLGVRADLVASGGAPVLPELRLEAGALLPVAVRFAGPPGATVHVVHLADARPIGGVTGLLAGSAGWTHR
ncbi:S8 family serine peptidase [Myxococcota bacterium]|nr:S8 family serine peptidase [Myxococcota bacterium]